MDRRTGWLVLLLLSLVVAPLLAGCGPQETPAATQRPAPTVEPTAEPGSLPPLTSYAHASGLFSISYPQGWSVDEEAEQVGFVDPEGSLRILIQFTNIGEVLDEQQLRAVIDGFFSPDGFGGMPGLERGEQTVQPDGSILVEYSFENQGRPAYGGTFFEQRGTVVYFLSFWALDATEWEGAVLTFNEVARSFVASEYSGGVPFDWNILTSQVGGYEIAYPPEWEAAEDEGDAFIQLDEETFLLIQVLTDLPSSDPLESERLLVEDFIAQIRQDDPDADIQGPDTLIISGEEAFFADFTYVDYPGTGLENKGTVIAVVRGGQLYQFLLFTLSADAGENIPLFTTMVLSFQFTR